jgi:hypothetical protein
VPRALGRHPTCQKAAALGGPSSVKVPAASTLLDHPRTVDLRQADLLPRPDGWLTGPFDPANEVERFRVVLACSWSRRRCQRGDQPGAGLGGRAG